MAGLEGANSTEFDEKTTYPVIHIMPEQEGKEKGGTMRLGAYPCVLMPNSLAYQAYRSAKIAERHRHRYEFNQSFRKRLEEKGLVFSGEGPETGLMEIVEVKDHPFMVGSQFHPEFKSRPHRPHPLFEGFMKAVTGK